MTNPFDKSNWLWVLFAYYKDFDVIKDVASEIFDSPEDCFEKYPENWHKIDKTCYFLRVLPKIEKYRDAEYLQLIPVPYSSKKS